MKPQPEGLDYWDPTLCRSLVKAKFGGRGGALSCNTSSATGLEI